MLPLRKDWSIIRQVERAERRERDKALGIRSTFYSCRSLEELREMERFYVRGRDIIRWWSSTISGGDVQLDIRVSDIETQPGGGPTFYAEFRCLQCGGRRLNLADSNDPAAECRCETCGIIGPWGPPMTYAKWLALEELRYGHDPVPESWKSFAAKFEGLGP